MLDALLEAGYSLRDAASALNLSAADLIDAADSAAEPLAALDRFARQVAELQLLDSRMQALKALVEVCKQSTDLEKKRLAAQAILRFDLRPDRATGYGGRSYPPRSSRDPRESSDDAATPLPVPHTLHAAHNGESCAASVASARAAPPSADRVPRLPAEAGLDRHLHPSSPPPALGAGKPCEPSSTSAVAPRPIPMQPAPPTAHHDAHPPSSPAHLFTCRGVAEATSPAHLQAVAGHAISLYTLPARAPPSQSRRGDLRAAA